MRPLPPTLLGDQPSLDALFPRAKVCDYVQTERRGSYTRHPVGYVFLGGLPGSISHKPATALYAEPAQFVRDAVIPRCCNSALGSFSVIKALRWTEVGRMLVVARDALHIAEPLVAFVPYMTDEEIAQWVAEKNSQASPEQSSTSPCLPA